MSHTWGHKKWGSGRFNRSDQYVLQLRAGDMRRIIVGQGLGEPDYGDHVPRRVVRQVLNEFLGDKKIPLIDSLDSMLAGTDNNQLKRLNNDCPVTNADTGECDCEYNNPVC